MDYSSHVLKNGFEVILAPLKSSEAVTVLFLVKTGSKYEKKDENGVSHFLEHMLFKGTVKRPNTFAISEALDKVGGIYNAFTGKEYTGFYIKLAHSHLELALDVLSDMLLNSRFRQEDVEKERNVILEEIKLYQDTPTAYIGELFEELLYGDTPAGREIIGTEKTVSSFSSGDIKNYFSSHYGSKNSLLVIAGKMKEKETINLVKNYFLPFPKKTIPKKEKVVEKQISPAVYKFKKNTDQTHLCLGVRSFDMFDEKRYALALLNSVLGGGMSSRLFINIRERQGLAYYIKSHQELYSDSGYFMVQAGIAHQNIKKVVKLIINELKLLRKITVKEKEMGKAREHIKGITLLGLETSDAIASFLGQQKLLKGKIETPEQVFKKLNQISAKDLKQIAKLIFLPQTLNLALITSSNLSTQDLKKNLNLN
jgi:predicted Zn-dependent peptidase